LIQGRYKIIVGKARYGGWDGPIYPNSSSALERPDLHLPLDCGEGCLFDVVNDPGEHIDLSSEHPEIFVRMKQRLAELRENFYENNDKNVDACPQNIDIPCACWMAINYYGGFYGPYQEVDLHTLSLRFAES
jgi:hypothetical protein